MLDDGLRIEDGVRGTYVDEDGRGCRTGTTRYCRSPIVASRRRSRRGRRCVVPRR